MRRRKLEIAVEIIVIEWPLKVFKDEKESLFINGIIMRLHLR